MVTARSAAALALVDLVLTDLPYGIGAPTKARPIWNRSKRAMYAGPSSTMADGTQTGRQRMNLQPSRGRENCSDLAVTILPTCYCKVGRWMFWDKLGCRLFGMGRLHGRKKLTGFQTMFKKCNMGFLLSDGERHHPDKSRVTEWKSPTFAPDARTVCDPFMGAGTTGVAARMGLQFVGIERERQYFWMQPATELTAHAQPLAVRGRNLSALAIWRCRATCFACQRKVSRPARCPLDCRVIRLATIRNGDHAGTRQDSLRRQPRPTRQLPSRVH